MDGLSINLGFTGSGGHGDKFCGNEVNGSRAARIDFSFLVVHVVKGSLRIFETLMAAKVGMSYEEKKLAIQWHRSKPKLFDGES